MKSINIYNQLYMYYHFFYLKLPHNSVVIVEVVFGLFSSEKFEGVEPLCKTLEVLLTLQLIGKDLSISGILLLIVINKFTNLRRLWKEKKRVFFFLQNDHLHQGNFSFSFRTFLLGLRTLSDGFGSIGDSFQRISVEFDFHWILCEAFLRPALLVFNNFSFLALLK